MSDYNGQAPGDDNSDVVEHRSVSTLIDVYEIKTREGQEQASSSKKRDKKNGPENQGYRVGKRPPMPPKKKEHIHGLKFNKSEDVYNTDDYDGNIGPGNMEESKTELKFEDLDLDTPYYIVEETEVSEAESPTRQRWTNEGEVINDILKVPKGWNDQEPDLDPSDFVSQIKRCEERIQDGIMPWLFEKKLEDFKGLKMDKEMRMSRYPGLNWEIVQRIEDLIRLKAWYESGNDDKHNHLPNIKAIITAYESKKLLWNMGLVTYWWGGVQRSQPRPFRVDEFWCLVKAAGKESIWVEGMFLGPTPRLAALTNAYRPLRAVPQTSAIYLNLRLPGSTRTKMFPFVNDTGSEWMAVYEDDLLELQLLDFTMDRAPLLPLTPFASQAFRSAFDQHMIYEIFLIEVCLYTPDGDQMTSWDTVPVVVRPGRAPSEYTRLDGPWLRWKLFTLTLPNTFGGTYVFDDVSAFTTLVPTLGVNARPYDHPHLPKMTYEPAVNPSRIRRGPQGYVGRWASPPPQDINKAEG